MNSDLIIFLLLLVINIIVFSGLVWILVDIYREDRWQKELIQKLWKEVSKSE